jgi:hypothetical protein
MVTVEDLRGDKVRKEANAHSVILEKIVAGSETHPVWTKIKSTAGRCYTGLEFMAGGYIAGHIAGGGNSDVAIQWAEYAAVTYVGIQAGIVWPLRKTLNHFAEKSRTKTKNETTLIELPKDKNGVINYTPDDKPDLFYDINHPAVARKNQIEESYWTNLATAQKPIGKTIGNVFRTAASLYILSSIVDLEVNIADWFGPNLIEKGLQGVHYLFGTVPALTDTMAKAQHPHIGDFGQMHMLYTGAAYGVVKSARQFVCGNYQHLKAKIKN